MVEDWEVEIMSEAQERAFRKVKETRGNEEKFETMYKAIGKPLPDTYRESQDTTPLPILTSPAIVR